MEVVAQTLDELLSALSPLDVEWKDDVAHNIIERLQQVPIKGHYDTDDIKRLLDANFQEGLLICGLFLGLSKDRFHGALAAALGEGGAAA